MKEHKPKRVKDYRYIFTIWTTVSGIYSEFGEWIFDRWPYVGDIVKISGTKYTIIKIESQRIMVWVMPN